MTSIDRITKQLSKGKNGKNETQRMEQRVRDREIEKVRNEKQIIRDIIMMF